MNFPTILTLGDTEITITRLDGSHYVLDDGRTIPQLADVASAEDAAEAISLYLTGSHPTQIAATKADLRRRLAARRYREEVSGITVLGVPIATDRDSRAMLHAALTISSLVPGWESEWKCADGGFRLVNTAMITDWVAAVATHVQCCFAKESELATYIELWSGDPDDLGEIESEIYAFILT